MNINFATKPQIVMYPFKNVLPPPATVTAAAIRNTANNNEATDSGTVDATTTQWPLNQAAYQNMANDQVDWAALAQQWIFMKETCTTDELLTAPPPPIISKHDFPDEKGEAPMEVEKDDEAAAILLPTNFPVTHHSHHQQHHHQHHHQQHHHQQIHSTPGQLLNPPSGWQPPAQQLPFQPSVPPPAPGTQPWRKSIRNRL